MKHLPGLDYFYFSYTMLHGLKIILLDTFFQPSNTRSKMWILNRETYLFTIRAGTEF